MCFTLTESDLISVNIPPSKVNQCILAMSVPVAEYWWWKFIGSLKMGEEKGKKLEGSQISQILPSLSTFWSFKTNALSKFGFLRIKLESWKSVDSKYVLVFSFGNYARVHDSYCLSNLHIQFTSIQHFSWGKCFPWAVKGLKLGASRQFDPRAVGRLHVLMRVRSPLAPEVKRFAIPVCNLQLKSNIWSF